jgi:hypothetical protein
MGGWRVLRGLPGDPEAIEGLAGNSDRELFVNMLPKTV